MRRPTTPVPYLGPLVAFLILRLHGVGALSTSGHLLPRDEHAMRNVFWLSAIPAAIAMVILIVVVRDIPRRDSAKRGEAGGSASLGGRFWGYLVVVLLFTLGNSTDAFLLLRANQLGVPVALAPILWALLNFVEVRDGHLRRAALR